MKLLIITDLHSWSNEEYNITRNLTDYDICFLLGDISVEYLKELKEIIKTPLYGLNGNHDGENIESVGIENLHCKCINFNGLTFSGFQGSARYKSGPWCMYTQEDSSEICKDIQAADVFLTHDGILDVNNSDVAHAGLRGISEYIENNKPILHIHGHIHENKEKTIKHGSWLIGSKRKITKSIAVYKAAIIDTDKLAVEILY